MTKKKDPKLVDLEKVAEQLAAENAQLTDQVARERADAINLRRRHQEELQSLRGSIKADVVEELLPVIDNFYLSLQHVPEDLADNNFVKGVQSVVKQFERTLSEIGVERIQTVGQPFDPETMEAVSSEEGDGPEVVSEEVQSGYKLGDHIIRHAMVRVRS